MAIEDMGDGSLRTHDGHYHYDVFSAHEHYWGKSVDFSDAMISGVSNALGRAADEMKRMNIELEQKNLKMFLEQTQTSYKNACNALNEGRFNNAIELYSKLISSLSKSYDIKLCKKYGVDLKYLNDLKFLSEFNINWAYGAMGDHDKAVVEFLEMLRDQPRRFVKDNNEVVIALRNYLTQRGMDFDKVREEEKEKGKIADNYLKPWDKIMPPIAAILFAVLGFCIFTIISDTIGLKGIIIPLIGCIIGVFFGIFIFPRLAPSSIKYRGLFRGETNEAKSKKIGTIYAIAMVIITYNIIVMSGQWFGIWDDYDFGFSNLSFKSGSEASAENTIGISLDNNVFQNGEKITVRYNVTKEMANNMAYITIFPAGAEHDNYGEYKYISKFNRKNGVKNFKSPGTGEWEFRLYKNTDTPIKYATRADYFLVMKIEFTVK